MPRSSTASRPSRQKQPRCAPSEVRKDHNGVPKHLARRVHDLYFEPQYEEFRPRTMWSLSNAFTSAFKELDPIPQFKATAKLGAFLEERLARKF